jgi:hypothetical protein
MPFLKNACPSDSPIVELVQRLLEVPAEIRAVHASPVTGNAVIEYDVATVTEGEVLEFLRHAVHLCLRHRHELASMGPDGVLAAADRFENLVRRAVRHRLALDRSIEMPHDLLA